MTESEAKVRASFGGPDLWRKSGGETLQGYAEKLGPGPWWSAELLAERMSLAPSGALSVRENGEANSYALMQDDKWLMSVLLNGELLSEVQRASLHKLAAAWNAYEGDGWINVKDGLPELQTEVLAGYWYRDTWLKGDPWLFSVGICFMFEELDDPCFPQGKRWKTHGCSHSAITHWRRMPALPAIPQEQING